jgi:hypothetical protein
MVGGFHTNELHFARLPLGKGTNFEIAENIPTVYFLAILVDGVGEIVRNNNVAVVNSQYAICTDSPNRYPDAVSDPNSAMNFEAFTDESRVSLASASSSRAYRRPILHLSCALRKRQHCRKESEECEGENLHGCSNPSHFNGQDSWGR